MESDLNESVEYAPGDLMMDGYESDNDSVIDRMTKLEEKVYELESKVDEMRNNIKAGGNVKRRKGTKKRKGRKGKGTKRRKH